MKRMNAGLLAVGVMAMTGAAAAGYKSYSQVTVVANDYARGTVVGAHHSSDSTQQISCNTYAYDNGNQYGGCWARSASNVYMYCSGSNAAIRDVMASAGPASYIYFALASDGYTCQQVTVSNGSVYADY